MPYLSFPSATTLRSILMGLGFFLLGSASDLVLQEHARARLVALTTDALLGIAVGVVVLMYERQQRKSIVHKLEVIRLMNHHVRNSLQVISYAAGTQQERLAREVRIAVERIEWALREVLPGQKDDVRSLLSHLPSEVSEDESKLRVRL